MKIIIIILSLFSVIVSCKEKEEEKIKPDLTRTEVIKLIAIATNPLNLIGVNLSGVDLSGLYLDKATLTGANLSGANLSGAKIDGANLVGANIDGAEIDGAEIFHYWVLGADTTNVKRI